MGFLSNRVLDYGLAVLTTEVDTLYLCTDLPATYEQASEIFAIAVKLAPLVSDPRNSEQHPGREVRVGPVTDGTVTGTGMSTFWALVDSATGTLLAAGPVLTPDVLHAGNFFELTEFTIGIPPS